MACRENRDKKVGSRLARGSRSFETLVTRDLFARLGRGEGKLDGSLAIGLEDSSTRGKSIYAFSHPCGPGHRCHYTHCFMFGLGTYTATQGSIIISTVPYHDILQSRLPILCAIRALNN